MFRRRFAKKSRKNGNPRDAARPFYRKPRFECLEGRHMLSAGNLFAQFVGILNQPGDTDRIPISIAPQEVGIAADTVFLGFQTQGRGGGSFDPAAVEIRRADGTLVNPQFALADLPGSTDSVAVAQLQRGDYTLLVSGTLDGRSQYQVDVYLVGDVDGDHVVGQYDLDVIRLSYGAKAGDARYQLAADANLDGRITSLDLSLARRNQALSQTALCILGLSVQGSAGWGGVYDRVTAATPAAGYDADAPMQFFESQIGWVQPLASTVAPQGGVWTVPGDWGETAVIEVDWFFREACYGNYLVAYQVDDLDGTIDLIVPGASGYAAAAARRELARLITEDCTSKGNCDHRSDPPKPDHVKTFQLAAGRYFSFYVVQGSYKDEPIPEPDRNKWFALSDANEDGYIHFQEADKVLDKARAWYKEWNQDLFAYKVEDLSADTAKCRNPGGLTNDADFNDVVFTVAMNQAPQFDPDPATDPDHYTTRIGLDRKKDAKVFDVDANDPESDPVTYAITGGNGEGAFTIDSETGQIRLAKDAKLTNDDQYVLTVQASDDKGHANETDVTINFVQAVGIFADTHAVEGTGDDTDDINIRFVRYTKSAPSDELTVEFDVQWITASIADFDDRTPAEHLQKLTGENLTVTIGQGNTETDAIVLRADADGNPGGTIEGIEEFKIGLKATDDYVLVDDDRPLITHRLEEDARYAHPHAFFQVVDGLTLFVRGTDDAGIAENNPGIHLNDVKQGNVYDCLYMAVVGALALESWEQIRDIITDNGDGTYTVAFDLMPQTVSAKLDRGPDMAWLADVDSQGRAEIWPLILEKAYAQRCFGYRNLSNNGSAVDAWRQLTGKSAETVSTENMSDMEIFQIIANADEAGGRVTLGTYKTLPDPPAGVDVFADHAYTFIGFVAGTMNLDLYNPWGERHEDDFPFDWLNESFSVVDILESVD